jgi:hypothetical protein
MQNFADSITRPVRARIAKSPLLSTAPNLTEEPQLLGIAQIGLGLAGFVGLLTVIRSGTGAWEPRDLKGLALLLDHALALVAFSLLPIVGVHLIGNRKLVWQVISVAVCLFLFWEVTTNCIAALHAKSGQGPSLLFWVIFVPLSTIFAVTILFNVKAGRPKLYYVALFWILSGVGIQFYLLLTRFLGNLK